MKRTGFSTFRRPEPKPAKQISYVPPPRPAVVASAPAAPRPILSLPKTQGRTSQAIRDSARDEECQVRIVGACDRNPETTVWSHWPGLDGDRGMGMKSFDLCGAYTCAACHDVVDGRRPLPPGASKTSVALDWHAGHLRSLVILGRKGLL